VKNLSGKPFALIGVHLNYDRDDASMVKKVMVKEQLNWRSFVDRGAISDKWKPAGTPSYYIIDSQGVIRYKWAGAPRQESHRRGPGETDPRGGERRKEIAAVTPATKAASIAKTITAIRGREPQ
jgi:hypothetical protein